METQIHYKLKIGYNIKINQHKLIVKYNLIKFHFKMEFVNFLRMHKLEYFIKNLEKQISHNIKFLNTIYNGLQKISKYTILI